MNVFALHTLLQVARSGSFAAASRQLNVDPSAVSRIISGLETELGLRLFERSTRRLALTDAGREYVVRIEPLLEELDAAGDAARQGQRAIAGRIRLATSVAFGQEIIVPMLPVVRHSLPEVELDLILSDDAVDLVGAQIDIAIRLAPAPTGDLISSRLMTTRYHVVASPDYLAQRPAVQTPQDLMQQECLRLGLPEHRDAWHFRSGRDTETIRVSGAVVVSNVLVLREAARTGLGLALLADWLVRDDLAAGRLVDVFPHTQATATDFDTAAWLLYPSRRYLPQRTRAVLDLIRKHAVSA